jgi:hypothetical protein
MSERRADLRALVFAKGTRGQLPPSGHRRTVARNERPRSGSGEPPCLILKSRKRDFAAKPFDMVVANLAGHALVVGSFDHFVHANAVCTENLSTAIVVMKSAQDGA